MSSESRDRADEETVAELKARIEQLEEKVDTPSMGRRAVLGGSAGVLALLFGSATASAGTNEVGTIGTPANPIDVYGEDIFLQDAAADPSSNGQIAMNGTDVKVYTGGVVKNMSNIGSGGGGVDVEDGGTTVVAGASAINMATNLSVSDDGDGTVSVDASGGGGASGKDIAVAQGDITLADGESFVIARLHGSDHDTTTLDVYTAGVATTAFATPSGLELRVYNDSTSTELTSITTGFTKPASPTSLSVGSDDIRIEIVNGTGGVETVAGFLTAVYA